MKEVLDSLRLRGGVGMEYGGAGENIFRGGGGWLHEGGVVGLVETHEKYQRIDWVGKIRQMRKLKDKKGGSDDTLVEEKKCSTIVKHYHSLPKTIKWNNPIKKA